MSQPIVCWPNVHRYYGEKPELLESYRQIEASGNCPFCEPHIQNPLLYETDYWIVVCNQFPYPNVSSHLLILPRRHVIALADLHPAEWAGMYSAMQIVESLLEDGGGLALRSGENGGVTLFHLHWHLIIPHVGEKGAIPVNFGIG